MAGCAAFRFSHVLTKHGVEPDEALHGLILHRVFILAPSVRAVNGVFHKGHLTAESRADAIGVLLVTDRTVDAIQGQGVGNGFEQAVIFGAIMMGGKVADRCVATCAFVF